MSLEAEIEALCERIIERKIGKLFNFKTPSDFRIAAGIETLHEAADRTGVSVRTISNLESGEYHHPRQQMKTCETLAAVYGCNAGELRTAARKKWELVKTMRRAS